MNKAEIHASLCKTIHVTYKAKDSDYGGSFAKVRQEYQNTVLIHLSEKLERLKTLMNGAEQKVLDESIDDTLLDLANYAIMELVERKAEKLAEKLEKHNGE